MHSNPRMQANQQEKSHTHAHPECVSTLSQFCGPRSQPGPCKSTCAMRLVTNSSTFEARASSAAHPQSCCARTRRRGVRRCRSPRFLAQARSPHRHSHPLRWQGVYGKKYMTKHTQRYVSNTDIDRSVLKRGQASASASATGFPATYKNHQNTLSRGGTGHCTPTRAHQGAPMMRGPSPHTLRNHPRGL